MMPHRSILLISGLHRGKAQHETAATAAEATTSVLPVIGEFAVPLIALGTSLASIFIKPKKAKQTPVINPSFQFL